MTDDRCARNYSERTCTARPMASFCDEMSVDVITIRNGWAAKVKRQPLAAMGIGLLVVFAVCAVFAPWLAPQDPAQLDLAGRLSAPRGAHWIWTDRLWRRIHSRTVYRA